MVAEREYEVSDWVRYLVRLCIVNKEGCMSVYQYFCNNKSPSEIANNLGITKYMVRGYIQRGERGFKELSRMGVNVCKDIYEINMRFLVDRGVMWCRCPICGMKLDNKEALMAHVRLSHSDVVEELIKKMLGEIRHGS